MTRVVYFLLLTALFTTQTLAGPARNEWQMKPFQVPHAPGPPSLADAHLSRQDRAAIYNAVDDKILRDSYAGSDRERAVVFSVGVSRITLAADGSTQFYVVGPETFCGSGGCPVHIFVRQNGRLHLALRADVESFFVKKTVTNGFHDIAVSWHFGADESRYTAYRWTGLAYKQVDCYNAKFSNDRKTAALTTCKPEAPPHR